MLRTQLVGSQSAAMLRFAKGQSWGQWAMILGIFSTSVYTAIHVIISLIGIATGFVALFALAGGHRLAGWTFWFLLFTILTSLTGFGFPITTVTPGIIVGILSLIVLLFAVIALYSFNLGGVWRWIFVVCAAVAQWFNVFVLIVQGFMKVGYLHDLAPTQSEPPFLTAQLAAMALFVVLTVLALRRFHPPTTA